MFRWGVVQVRGDGDKIKMVMLAAHAGCVEREPLV